MKALQPPTGAATALLGAIAAVSEHPDDPRVRRFIAFVADELGVTPTLPAAPLGPLELAALLPAREADKLEVDNREAAVQRLVLAAMLVPPLSRARLNRLCGYAAALGRRHEPALRDLWRTITGRHRLLSFGLMRRFPPSERVRAAWRRGDLGARFRLLKTILRIPDARTAARFRALGELPEGTLGRAYVEHCRRYGYALPGERGGVPEPIAFHDMGHALCGEPTDVPGETRMAGFEAGCMGEGGFTMLTFTLLLFNLGARLPTDARPQVGQVDIDLLLGALARGQRSTLDVLTWDPLADVAVPVAELRRRYNIVDAPA